jgi:hypothetical protein
MYDLKITYPDGVTAAVEITAAMDEQQIRVRKSTKGHATRWQESNMVGGWDVRVSAPDVPKDFNLTLITGSGFARVRSCSLQVCGLRPVNLRTTVTDALAPGFMLPGALPAKSWMTHTEAMSKSPIGRLLEGLGLRKLDARGQEVQSFALRYGLRYDPLDSKPFLGLGQPGQTLAWREQNELTGRWRDLPVREVDRKMSKDTLQPHASPPVHMQHHVESHYLSVLSADLPAVLPNLWIRGRVLMDWVGSRPSILPHKVDFQSTEFNRLFEVTAEDTTFTAKLIDASMIDWLLSTGPGFTFVLGSRTLLITCLLLPVADLAKIFDTAKDLTDRIPQQIWIEYGTG